MTRAGTVLVVLMLTSRLAWSQTARGLGPFRLIKEWKKITYDSTCLKDSSVEYRSSQNEISGIKVYRNTIYLSIPRSGPGVPVTLAYTSLYGGNPAPRIQPFPSWELQATNNCSNLIYVLGFEIDTEGRMWVLDNGFVASEAICPPKLVVFDLNSLEWVQMGSTDKCKKKHSILRVHQFGEELLPPGSDYMLNDLVIDNVGWFAYITDTSGTDPGLVVYDWNKDESWKLRSPEMQKQNTGVTYKGSGNVNGIALSPRSQNRTLYFSPLDSLKLYSVPANLLKSNTSDIADAVREVGHKPSITDGMEMDSEGILYFGLEGTHSVAKWNSKSGNFSTQQEVIATDPSLTWVASFGFDLAGYIYFTTNNDPAANGTERRYRIFAANIRARSYMYSGVSSMVPFN